jgi:multidrug transporter EmrE-like cation transporter
MKNSSSWLLWICLPIFNTLNQVAMKMTAGVVAADTFGVQWLIHAATSPYIWLSFACEIINFTVWMAILKRHNVSEAFPLTAVSYATLMLTSWFFFHEPMQWQQLAGIMLIMMGIVMLGFGKKPATANGGDHA